MQHHHQQSGEPHAHQEQPQPQNHQNHHHTSILQAQPFPQACTPSCPYPHIHTHAQSHPSPAESAGGVPTAGSPGGGGVATPDTGASGDNSALAATAPPQYQYQYQYQHQYQHHRQSPSSAAAAAARFDEGEAHPASAKRKMPYPDDPDETAAGGAADTAASRQTRSKRNRYIAIACNECKRRKIKCNGETPCQRCGNLKLDCLYAPNCCSNSFRDSDEFRIMSAQMAHLQEQVDGLARTMSELRSGSTGAAAEPSAGPQLAPVRSDARASSSLSSAATHSPTPPPSSSTLSMTPSPMVMAHNQPWASSTQPYRGPSSSGFSLDIARRTIHSMGYNAAEENTEPQQPPPQPQPSSHLSPSSLDTADPLLEYSIDDIIRHMRFYDDEIAIMYPFLEIDPLVSYIRSIYPMLVDNVRRGVAPPGSPNPLASLQILKVKIVMCCSIAVQAAGETNKAERIFAGIEDRINRMLMTDPTDLANMVLLSLVAGYRWFTNDEILGWRSIGHLARMCQELGLHTLAGLQRIPEGKERFDALGVFWTLYTLDRRWAFSTGLPYVLQDTDIDPNLPLPDKFPYLNAMVDYSRVAAKVWRHVTNLGPVLARDVRQDDIESLDREILQWYEVNVPDEVKVRSWDKEKATLTPSYNLRRLRLWTYLRFNQIRIWLYTPILHSATSIMTHPTYAQRVVEMACDTIRYLAHVNATTNIYRRMQLFYHQFLTSAISVLFLASVHAPVRFSSVCRHEFYVALELVKELSSKSWVSQRLWKAIGSLKEVAPRFGMAQDGVSTKASHNGHNGHDFQQQRQQHGRQPATKGLQGAGMGLDMSVVVGMGIIGMGMGMDVGVGVGAGLGIGAGVSSPPLGTAPTMRPPQPQAVSPAPLGSMVHTMNPTSAAATPPTGDATLDGTAPISHGHSQSPSGTPPNGRLLQTEMSRIYEGYVSSTGDGMPDMITGGSFGPATGGPMDMFGSGDEMFHIFRDLY